MDLPVEVINAVKDDKQLSLDLPKARKPYVKKLTKRILHAIGNGLRTATSVSNALGVDKTKIQSNLWHMKAKGLIYASKQEGKVELKYHLTTDKPMLGQLDLTKPKRKLKAVKRVVKVARPLSKEDLDKLEPPTLELQPPVQVRPSYVRHLENRVEELVTANNALQQELVHAQAECFDLKAVIKYLERKAN
jgi:DNA-binding transcriptional MocR family regulator